MWRDYLLLAFGLIGALLVWWAPRGPDDDDGLGTNFGGFV